MVLLTPTTNKAIVLLSLILVAIILAVRAEEPVVEDYVVCSSGLTDKNESVCCATQFDSLLPLDKKKCCLVELQADVPIDCHQCCPLKGDPFFDYLLKQAAANDSGTVQLVNECCKLSLDWARMPGVCSVDNCSKESYFVQHSRSCCEQASFPSGWDLVKGKQYCCKNVDRYWRNHKKMCCLAPIASVPLGRTCPRCLPRDDDCCWEEPSDNCPCDYEDGKCPSLFAVTWRFDDTIYSRPDATMAASETPVAQRLGQNIHATTLGDASLTIKRGWTYYVFDDEVSLLQDEGSQDNGNDNEDPDSTFPSTPTEPTDPTDPTDPTEPTEPTDPTEPTKPSTPTEPTEPSTPTTPTPPTPPKQDTDNNTDNNTDNTDNTDNTGNDDNAKSAATQTMFHWTITLAVAAFTILSITVYA